MKKKVLATFFLILCLAMAFLPALLQAAEELVILHTNDLHGVSLARLGTLLELQREDHPELVWIDAGDLFSGTPVSSLFKGEAEQKAILALGVDAMAVGNHDFDYGLDVLVRSQKAGLPWLAANILMDDGTSLFPPYLLKQVGDTRLLIVGLTTTATPRMSFPEHVTGLSFADPAATLEEILRRERGNYDVCIVLSHLGYGEDLLLAQKVPGITAIVGGHSHTILQRPVRIADTLITQAGSSARYLGKIVIDVANSHATGTLIPIDESLAPHPVIAAIDELYGASVASEMDAVIGYNKHGYVKRQMGILLNSALLAFTGADAAIYNGGGVRAGLPQGPIRLAHVFAVEPFGNEAVVVTLKGSDFAELLHTAAKRSDDFYQGPRLVDLGQDYTVVTSDFLTSPTSNYPMLARGQIVPLGSPVRSILVEYLRNFVLDQKEGA